jgi:hypothetical protein
MVWVDTTAGGNIQRREYQQLSIPAAVTAAAVADRNGGNHRRVCGGRVPPNWLQSIAADAGDLAATGRQHGNGLVARKAAFRRGATCDLYTTVKPSCCF